MASGCTLEAFHEENEGIRASLFRGSCVWIAVSDILIEQFLLDPA